MNIVAVTFLSQDFDNIKSNCFKQMNKLNDDPAIRALRRLDPTIVRLKWESDKQFEYAYKIMERVRRKLRKGAPGVTLKLKPNTQF